MGNDLAHNEFYARYTSAQFSACSQKANGVTSDMLDCGSTEFDRLDRLLNETYRRKMASLSPARQAILRASERTWLHRRKTYCDGYVTQYGGTAQLLFQDTCYLNTTIHRTLFIRRFK